MLDIIGHRFVFNLVSAYNFARFGSRARTRGQRQTLATCQAD